MFPGRDGNPGFRTEPGESKGSGAAHVAGADNRNIHKYLVPGDLHPVHCGCGVDRNPAGIVGSADGQPCYDGSIDLEVTQGKTLVGVHDRVVRAVVLQHLLDELVCRQSDP